MLIILTGPPGAGKSTVGEKLAYTFPRSVYFSLDDLRHFVKGGYVEPWNDTDEEGQSTLATTVALDMIKHYLAKDYVVIIDDVIDDEGMKQYQEYFDNVHGFLLLPSAEALRQRDSQRISEKHMGQRSADLQAEFSNKNYKLLRVINNSKQSVDETVTTIKTMLE